MTNKSNYKISRQVTRSNSQVELIARPPSAEPRWWGAVWRGLVVDPAAKHYRAMRSALWVYVYLVVHADRRTGTLRRKLGTIARETGISPRVIQYGISKLRRGGYITTKNTGRFLEIGITKWKPLRQAKS
jgi:hypothetical protein